MSIFMAGEEVEEGQGDGQGRPGQAAADGTTDGHPPAAAGQCTTSCGVAREDVEDEAHQVVVIRPERPQAVLLHRLGEGVDTGVVQPDKHSVLCRAGRHDILVTHGMRSCGQRQVAGGVAGLPATPEWHFYDSGQQVRGDIWKTSIEINSQLILCVK